MSFQRQHYRQWVLLGEGGEAHVYRARQVSLDRLVAIRVVKPAAAARAEREARTLSGLRHQGIATAIDFGTDQGRFHLVQDYVRGASPANLKHLPPLFVLDQLYRLAAVLGFLHGRNLVHGDLNPGNLLLTQNQGPVLIDFGMIHAIGETCPQAMGAPRYFSPEHFAGGPFTPASDVFSFGLLAYRLLQGSDLLEQLDIASLRDALLSGLYDYSKAPAEAAPLLAACLCLAPEDRAADMEEVAELLEIAITRTIERLGPVLSATHRREGAALLDEAIRSNEYQALAEAEIAAEREARWHDAWELLREMAALQVDSAPLVEHMERVQSHMARKRRGWGLLVGGTLALVAASIALLLIQRVPERDMRSGAGAALAELRASNPVSEDGEPISDSSPLLWVTVPNYERYAEFWIDGKPTVISAGRVRLAPGIHKFRARMSEDSIWVEGTLGEKQ